MKIHVFVEGSPLAFQLEKVKGRADISAPFRSLSMDNMS